MKEDYNKPKQSKTCTKKSHSSLLICPRTCLPWLSVVRPIQLVQVADRLACSPSLWILLNHSSLVIAAKVANQSSARAHARDYYRTHVVFFPYIPLPSAFLHTEFFLLCHCRYSLISQIIPCLREAVQSERRSNKYENEG